MNDCCGTIDGYLEFYDGVCEEGSTIGMVNGVLYGVASEIFEAIDSDFEKYLGTSFEGFTGLIRFKVSNIRFCSGTASVFPEHEEWEKDPSMEFEVGIEDVSVFDSETDFVKH